MKLDPHVRRRGRASAGCSRAPILEFEYVQIAKARDVVLSTAEQNQNQNRESACTERGE